MMFKALSIGPVSVVAPIVGLSQLIPAIFGILILKETFSASRTLGVILGFIAILLLSQ